MSEKEQTPISIKLSAKEIETLDAWVAQAGTNRSEYIRMMLFDPPKRTTDDLEALVKHGIFIVNQVHEALYSIADAEGRARRFLTTAELGKVYDEVRARAIKYAVEFPEKFVAVQALVKAASKESK